MRCSCVEQSHLRPAWFVLNSQRVGRNYSPATPSCAGWTGELGVGVLEHGVDFCARHLFFSNFGSISQPALTLHCRSGPQSCSAGICWGGGNAFLIVERLLGSSARESSVTVKMETCQVCGASPPACGVGGAQETQVQTPAASFGNCGPELVLALKLAFSFQGLSDVLNKSK